MKTEEIARIFARAAVAVALLGLGTGCDGTAAGADAGAADAADSGATGYVPQTVAEKPATAIGNYAETFGKYTAIALDENGDPGVAWLFVDANSDGKKEDSAIWFRAWDPAAKAFAAPVQVAIIDEPNSGFQGPLALAYDASAKAWVLFHQVTIAHPNFKGGLALAVSKDRGATWTSQVVSDGASPIKATQLGATNWPTVVAAGGKVHLAYFHNWTGVVYTTGALGSDPAAWPKTVAPWLPLGPGETAGPIGVNTRVGLALDSAGTPALAYWSTTANEKDLRLGYWRPGQAAPVLVAKSLDSNATREVWLGFAGLQPRVIFAGLVAPQAGLVSGYWAATSVDGAAWTSPANLPFEAGAGAGLAFFAAFSAKGQGVGAWAANSGNGSDLCGKVKTSRSSDFAAWTTCGPDSSNRFKLKPIATSLALAFDGSDNLSLVVTNLDSSGGAPAGVILWKF